MKAVDPSTLAWADHPSPPLRPGCVRLRVRAAGINRADLMQRAGHYPPPPGASPVLGLEAVGEVIEADAPGAVLGDRRVALLPGGGYASEVVVPFAHTLPVPDRADDVEAAGFIEVFATAWLNLARLAGLADAPKRQKVLIHAGASGVGTASIQLVRHLGHHSFVTLGSADKLTRCLDLGADAGHVRHDGPWLPAVQAWAPDGVFAALDPVGAPYLEHHAQALAVDGTLVLIGLMGGRSAPLDLGRVLMKRLRVLGSTLRSRDEAFKAGLVSDLHGHLWPAWASGELRPVHDRSFPITNAAEALDYVATDVSFGKVVLTVA